MCLVVELYSSTERLSYWDYSSEYLYVGLKFTFPTRKASYAKYQILPFPTSIQYYYIVQKTANPLYVYNIYTISLLLSLLLFCANAVFPFALFTLPFAFPFTLLLVLSVLVDRLGDDIWGFRMPRERSFTGLLFPFCPFVLFLLLPLLLLVLLFVLGA